MIPSENAFIIFQEQATRILSSVSADTALLISAQDQEEKLQQCRQMIQLERFFFVIDNYTFTTESIAGVYQMLGYADKTFTLKKFFSLVHPTHNRIQLINRYVLLETLIKGERTLCFLQPVFTANIALKHVSGQYLLFKWQACPFQINTAGCLLSYLNEFTFISFFGNESSHLRVSEKNGKPIAWFQELSAVTKRRLQKQSGFSNKEMLILAHYADQPQSINATVADFFSLKISSVVTFNKRIIRKAETSFARPFHTAREVAVFLRFEGLL